jgi:hypothetical protein
LVSQVRVVDARSATALYVIEALIRSHVYREGFRLVSRPSRQGSSLELAIEKIEGLVDVIRQRMSTISLPPILFGKPTRIRLAEIRLA